MEYANPIMSEIIYSWSITKLEYILEENSLNNVIKTVHWTYTAQEVEGNKYSASCSNSYPLPTPSPDKFIDYTSLTEEQVIEWLETNLDVSVLKNNLINEINLKYNPPIKTTSLPWIKVEEVVAPIVEEVIEEIIEPDTIEHVVEEIIDEVISPDTIEPVVEEVIEPVVEEVVEEIIDI